MRGSSAASFNRLLGVVKLKAMGYWSRSQELLKCWRLFINSEQIAIGLGKGAGGCAQQHKLRSLSLMHVGSKYKDYSA